MDLFNLNLPPHAPRRSSRLYEQIAHLLALEREPSMAEYALRIRKEFGIGCRPDEPVPSFPTPREKKSHFYAFTVIEAGDTFFGTHLRVELLQERRKPWGIQKFFACIDAMARGETVLPKSWEHTEYIFFPKDTFIDIIGNAFMPGFERVYDRRTWSARMFKITERYPCTSIAAVADKPPHYKYL